MAPPRVHCLNTGRVALKNGTRLFSSTRTALADPPIHKSSAIEALLGFVGGHGSKTNNSGKFAPMRSNLIPGMPSASSTVNAMNLARRSTRDPSKPVKSLAEEQAANRMKEDLTRQIHRRWKTGDVYAPHDLSGVEMSKWKKRERKSRDVFDMLNYDPIPDYKNFAMLAEYTSPMGRIMHSDETGLRPVNQRKIAKAIRRAIGIGMLPSAYRHPEILNMHGQTRNQASAGRSPGGGASQGY
ncbi:ribosomal protein S18 [Calycina marina]|uniref:Small ribosomal subunit protein bS18m n=1 Tax=Calycina marina TaxID=1763456 RepID=A0A9P8CFI1_9HELO|nr:ribosomal protein S18 [Calycina marina]